MKRAASRPGPKGLEGRRLGFRGINAPAPSVMSRDVCFFLVEHRGLRPAMNETGFLFLSLSKSASLRDDSRVENHPSCGPPGGPGAWHAFPGFRFAPPGAILA